MSLYLYFTDNNYIVLGTATTTLQDCLKVTDDLRTEDVDSGVATFEATIPWNDENRQEVEKCVKATNYILARDGDASDFYSITETELDTKARTMSFYAEAAGLDVINTVALELTDANKVTSATITQWFNLYLKGTNVKIGRNEMASNATAMTLTDTSEVSVAEKLKQIADRFNCEIEYQYALSDDGFRVPAPTVNIYKKRGADNGVRLRLDHDIDKIVAKENTEDFATSLLAYGPVPNGYSAPIDLRYAYELEPHTWTDIDGVKFEIVQQRFDDKQQTKYCIQAVDAVKKYGVITNVYEDSDIKQASAATMSLLLKVSSAEALKKKMAPVVNYEVELSSVMPRSAHIGDTVYVVDEKGGLFLQSRLLKTEHSVSNGTDSVILGDFVRKNDDISSKVYALASQVQKISGAQLLKAITIDVSSSNGIVFIDDYVNTTLTAHLYLNDTELDPSEIEGIGVIKWYNLDAPSVVLGTGITYTIPASSEIIAANIQARLESV